MLSPGIQLKDLIALHTALPDSVDGNLINVQKMIRLATIVAPLLQVHTSQPPVNPNMELIKVLRVRIKIKTDSIQSSSNTCKNYLRKIYSQHANFLNAI